MEIKENDIFFANDYQWIYFLVKSKKWNLSGKSNEAVVGIIVCARGNIWSLFSLSY